MKKARSSVFILQMILIVIVFSFNVLSQNDNQSGTLTPSGSGYAAVNGLNIYYEIYGSGEPLILLHGGVGSIEMFAPILPQLSAGNKVIAIDFQGHGRTADIDRPLSYEALAEDIAGVMIELKISKANVMGYSLGGGAALQLAFKHPEMVNKLIIAAAPIKREGWYPEIQAGMGKMNPETAEAMKQMPFYQVYKKIAPRPEDWAKVLTKIGEMSKHDYDWSDKVKLIKSPVLIVVGDADAVKTSHAVEFFNLLGGGLKDAGWDGSGRPVSQLAILPGHTHYNMFMSPLLGSTAVQFLGTANNVSSASGNK